LLINLATIPRRPRVILPNVPQHIIQRGNNRQACFYADEDYLSYFEWLKEYSDKTECKIQGALKFEVQHFSKENVAWENTNN
jgi:REP element-mobilizing transposase RayT